MTIVGAIQPANFAEPSPREVARIIDQLRREKVPAIFGSEVFPSKVLEKIAREAQVRYVTSLRDDVLPGSTWRATTQLCRDDDDQCHHHGRGTRW